MVGTNAQLVKDWRVRNKERMVKCMGGKCQICGYSKSNRALEFHHIEPATKSFGFGAVRGNNKGWDSTAAELKKCILLCSNCHMEVEDGISMIPESYAKFDDTINEEIKAYRKESSAKNVKRSSVAQG